MRRNGPRYAAEEIARRGKEIYESKIRSQVYNEGNIGKIVAIDIETGDYEMDADKIAATDRLRVRLADPEIFCVRIGYQTVYWFSHNAKRV